MIHEQLPLPVPCYDFAPLTEPSVVPASAAGTSAVPGSLGVTGGEYKAQEHIHRDMADSRLLAIPTSRGRVSDLDPDWDRFLGISSALRLSNPLYRPL